MRHDLPTRIQNKPKQNPWHEGGWLRDVVELFVVLLFVVTVIAWSV